MSLPYLHLNARLLFTSALHHYLQTALAQWVQIYSRYEDHRCSSYFWWLTVLRVGLLFSFLLPRFVNHCLSSDEDSIVYLQIKNRLCALVYTNFCWTISNCNPLISFLSPSWATFRSLRIGIVVLETGRGYLTAICMGFGDKRSHRCPITKLAMTTNIIHWSTW